MKSKLVEILRVENLESLCGSSEESRNWMIGQLRSFWVVKPNGRSSNIRVFEEKSSWQIKDLKSRGVENLKKRRFKGLESRNVQQLRDWKVQKVTESRTEKVRRWNNEESKIQKSKIFVINESNYITSSKKFSRE